ncbi:Nucleotide modification associated domain 2 [compost metagenome]
MRVHTYVITTDAGSAPNYDPPAVTLAVCKPGIRKKAKVGELVLAFAGATLNPISGHSVVWAGIVSEVLPLTEYWNDPRFASKKPDRTDVPDNFYKPTGNGDFAWQPNPVHEPEKQDRDTGGLNVLVFDHAWRFGAFGPLLPEDFGLRMNDKSRRGERVADLPDSVWQRLETWLNAQPQVTIEAASDRKSSCSYTPRALLGSSQPASPTRRRC